MPDLLVGTEELASLWTSAAAAVRVGRVVEIDREGRARVDFPGNPGPPVPARTVVEIASGPRRRGRALPVLLVFEDGDLERPIILGLVRDRLATPASSRPPTPSRPSSRSSSPSPSRSAPAGDGSGPTTVTGTAAAGPTAAETEREAHDLPEGTPAKRKRLVLEAGEEISLRCGKSSVTLTRNGTVIVRGAKVVSRSSGVNKIKGASVSIN